MARDDEGEAARRGPIREGSSGVPVGGYREQVGMEGGMGGSEGGEGGDGAQSPQVQGGTQSHAGGGGIKHTSVLLAQ